MQNIDRRPPTLLKQFTLLQTPPGVLPRTPGHLYVVPNPKPDSLTLLTTPPLASYELTVSQFFDARSDGLVRIADGAKHTHADNSSNDDPQAEIVRYVRTPNGEGVGVIRADGCGEVWTFDWAKTVSLIKTGSWTPGTAGHVDRFVVIDAGMCCVAEKGTVCLLTRRRRRSIFRNALGRYGTYHTAYQSARDALRSRALPALRSTRPALRAGAHTRGGNYHSGRPPHIRGTV